MHGNCSFLFFLSHIHFLFSYRGWSKVENQCLPGKIQLFKKLTNNCFLSPNLLLIKMDQQIKIREIICQFLKIPFSSPNGLDFFLTLDALTRIDFYLIGCLYISTIVLQRNRKEGTECNILNYLLLRSLLQSDFIETSSNRGQCFAKTFLLRIIAFN